MLRGANGEEYEFWLDFGDELKNILTKRQVKKALTKANDLIMEKIDNPKTYFPDNIRKDDFGNQGRIFITDCCYDNVPDSFVTALMSVSLNNYDGKQEHYNYIHFTKDGEFGGYLINNKLKMKKLLLILLCLPMIGFGQQVYVPDDNFENYLEANGMEMGLL